MAEKIEVRYSIVGGGSPTQTSVYHKYIVYTDKNGVEYYGRGGPLDWEGVSTREKYTFGPITTEYGKYEEGTIDWDGNEPQPDKRETILASDNLFDVWNAIKHRLDEIADEYYHYLPVGQNSNSVVDDVLKDVGLPATKNPYNLPSPGSNIPLTYGFPELPEFSLPDWLKPAGAGFGQANTASPLVLDLDGDGVETSALGFGDGRSTTYFDIDNDGFAERTGWAAGGDGILALDKNGNGKIDNQGELFGNSATFADGFAALKALDSNADGKITSADAQWSKLRVWVDADKDGVTDAGELKTLADLKITQVNLNATAQTNVYNNENAVSANSTFVMNGATRTVSDVWFRNDQMDTRFTGETTLNVKTLFLPTLKGFGNLKDLHVAMSGDAALLTLVENFVKNWSPARFVNAASLDADVKAILFKWAGVESVSSTSRGAYVDGKVIAFMEKLTGEYFGGGTTPVDPWGPAPGEIITKSFEMAFSALKTQLIVQAGGQALFDQKPFYDYVSGDIIGGVLGSAGVATLKAQATTASDKLGYWKYVTDLLLNVKEASEFTTAEKSALDAAINATAGSSYSWESLISLVPSPLSIIGQGTEQSDYFVGGRAADNLSGRGADDILDGAGGADYLSAGSGNDILIGGDGDDTLYGGTGNDIYVFDAGFGKDFIRDDGGSDTIKLGAGITASNLRFETNGTYLRIYVGANDRIELDKHFYDLEYGTNNYDEVEKIVFADGKTLDLKGSFTFTGTSASESIVGTVAADTIVGLGGDDNLNAGLGNDTYVFNTGFGKDSITDNGGSDTIKFGTGIAASSLRFETNGTELRIYVGASDKITLSNHFYDLKNGTNNYDEVEKIVFADGSSLDLKGSLTFTGTSASESIVGTAAADTIVGLGGDDNLNAGLGNDTYVFNTGFGKDSITDNGGSDTIKFGSGITASSLRFETNGTELRIYVGASDKITLPNHFYDLKNGTTTYDEVEKIVFADGKTLDLKASLTFTGTTAGEYIYGTAAADTIVGLGGDDTLYGGKGNDTYVFGAGFGKDRISDEGGTDTLKLESAFTTENISLADYNTYDTKLIATAGVHEITIGNQRYAGGTNAIEFLQFQDGFKADLLTYKSWVWGATTAQTTNGTVNADTILGRGGNDTIDGAAGNDALHGGSGDDVVKGGDGNDTVHGGIGNDTLYGDAGNDLLYGDDGLDKLYGGLGADIFVFRKDTAFKNIDVVNDFKTAELDKINVADILEGYNPATKAITDFVQITTSGANSLLFVDKDGGANGFVQIATITGVTGLTDEAALKNSGLLIAA